MLKYSDLKEDSVRNVLACFRIPNAFDTLEEITLICSFQWRLLSTWAPKYFTFCTTSSSFPLIFKQILSPAALSLWCFDFVQISIDWVFETFNSSLLPCIHKSRCLRSSFTVWLSWQISRDWKVRLVSSAYMETVEALTTFGRSLMEMKNNNGTKQDTCGTPTSMLPISESMPLTLQNCLRLKTTTTHSVEGHSVLIFDIVWHDPLCQMLS